MSPSLSIIDDSARRVVAMALAEDIGEGDVTTNALVSPDAMAQAVIMARTRCVIAGLPLAHIVFHTIDNRCCCKAHIQEGHLAEKGTIIATITGPAAAILTGERTALNFIQRLSGIATATNRFVELVRPWGTIILDTRKTTPGWRNLEKYAVSCGGGRNHRKGLYDMVLIKDNHRLLWMGDKQRSLADAVRAAKRRYPGLLVEIEVDTKAELADAIQGNPDWILLDNMEPRLLHECVVLADKRCKLEASGGISMDTIASIAATGVDAISLGCLTHSVIAADLSLEFTS